jgi:hypothetical protein
MTDNMRLWEALRTPDPAMTTKFQGKGFKGTSTDAAYTLRRMTEIFGPCGKGWGIRKPEYQVVEARPGKGEQMVICTVCVWYVEDDGTGQVCEIHGVGGKMAESQRKDGTTVADDDSFKKAYTDAVKNALKYIGASADIYLGLFDDDKYVKDVEVGLHAREQEKRRQEDAIAATAQKIHLGHIEEAESIADLDAWRAEHADRVAALPPDSFSHINCELICRGFELAATFQQFTDWKESQRARPRPWATECLPAHLKAKATKAYTSALERFKSAAKEIAA